jgi:hypothetical protein
MLLGFILLNKQQVAYLYNIRGFRISHTKYVGVYKKGPYLASSFYRTLETCGGAVVKRHQFVTEAADGGWR